MSDWSENARNDANSQMSDSPPGGGARSCPESHYNHISFPEVEEVDHESDFEIEEDADYESDFEIEEPEEEEEPVQAAAE